MTVAPATEEEKQPKSIGSVQQARLAGRMLDDV